MFGSVPLENLMWSEYTELSSVNLFGRRYPSGGGRLVELPNIALSDLILGDVRVRSVHKIGYGHNGDAATA